MLVGSKVSTTDKTAYFNDGIHSVPKFEIHVEENLIFIICCGPSQVIIKYIQSMEVH